MRALRGLVLLLSPCCGNLTFSCRPKRLARTAVSVLQWEELLVVPFDHWTVVRPFCRNSTWDANFRWNRMWVHYKVLYMDRRVSWRTIHWYNNNIFPGIREMKVLGWYA
jgi:hypothetical protein